MPQSRQRSPHHKRHGHHQKRSSHFLKVYQPFIPLVIITSGLLLLASLLGPNSTKPKTSSQPQVAQSQSSQTDSSAEKQVLAFATNISRSGLLSATNQRRSAAGVGSLKINTKLNNAAQAKANDMAHRNYWAHNTPDGNPPWVFITNAGYSYSRAGENLACGFDESSDVITGWYNSPSHRANLLLASYKDVGFGVANANDYNCGNLAATEQTIIVAMYGTPYTTTSTSKSKTQTSGSSSKSSTATKPASIAKPVATKKSATPVSSHTLIVTVADSNGQLAEGIKATIHSDEQVGYTNAKGQVTFTKLSTGKHTITLEVEGAKTITDVELASGAEEYNVSVVKPELAANQTSIYAPSETTKAASSQVSRLQLFADGYSGALLTVLIIGAIVGGIYVLGKHSLAAHRFIVKGERYMHTHKLVDVLVLLLIIALYFLTRSVGSIL